MYNKYVFRAQVWVYDGNGGWYFVSVPKKMTKEITEKFADYKRGWGSLKVTVSIGKTTWNTSIFPDNKTKSYLLPLKAAVRKQENIKEQQNVFVTLHIVI